MILFLVRHGETGHNREGLGLGQADVELTARGVNQARAAAARIVAEAPTMVLSSPLERAMYTARLIADGCRVSVASDHRLIELSAGDTEGLPFATIRDRYPTFLQEWMGPSGHAATLPGGESLNDVAARVRDFLMTLKGYEVDRVAIVSHNFVLRVLLCELLGIGPSGFRRIATDLASVSIAEVRSLRTSVLSLNDTCHLVGLDS